MWHLEDKSTRYSIVRIFRMQKLTSRIDKTQLQDTDQRDAVSLTMLLLT